MDLLDLYTDFLLNKIPDNEETKLEVSKTTAATASLKEEEKFKKPRGIPFSFLFSILSNSNSKPAINSNSEQISLPVDCIALSDLEQIPTSNQKTNSTSRKTSLSKDSLPKQNSEPIPTANSESTPIKPRDQNKPAKKSKKFEINIEGASTIRLTPNSTFITNSDVGNVEKDQYLSSFSSEGRPLCLLFCWLGALPAGVKKFAQLYLREGYDLLVIRFPVKAVAFPTKIDQVLLNEIIPILSSCEHKTKIIHGFSVGGFIWSRVMHQIDETAKISEGHKHEMSNLTSSIKCQVWDSVVSCTAAKLGIVKTVFPKSLLLQQTSKRILDTYFQLFYERTARIFEEGDNRFRNGPIPVPALFFYSKADELSPPETNQALQKEFFENGADCTEQFWEDSDHVLHMKVHTEEYQLTLKEFLEKNTRSLG